MCPSKNILNSRLDFFDYRDISEETDEQKISGCKGEELPVVKREMDADLTEYQLMSTNFKEKNSRNGMKRYFSLSNCPFSPEKMNYTVILLLLHYRFLLFFSFLFFFFFLLFFFLVLVNVLQS